METFDLDPLAQIERPVELHTVLDKLLSSNDRMVVLQGGPGTGKTTLAQQFVRLFDSVFPGGIEWRSGRGEPDYGFIPGETEGPSLLIFDGLDEVWIGVDRTLEDLRRRLDASPSLHVLVTSRPLPQLDELIKVNVTPLDLAETAKLMMMESGTDILPPQTLTLLAGGNPLIAALLGRMLRDRRNWPELVESLRSFRQPGLVDVRGRPLGANEKPTRAFISDVTMVNNGIMQLVHTDPDIVFQLPPRRFEEICAELFERLGYEVTLTPPSKDGGKDLIVVKKSDLGTMLTFVECKRYDPDRPVGVEIVRALNGVVEEGRATSGIVLTSSRFTKGAKLEQRKLQYRMTLQDYGDFKDLLARAMDPQRSVSH